MSRRDVETCAHGTIGGPEVCPRCLNELDESGYIWIVRPTVGMGAPTITPNVLINETPQRFRVYGPQWGWSDPAEYLISKEGTSSGGIAHPFRTEREAVEFMIDTLERRRRGLEAGLHKTDLELADQRRRFSEIENGSGDNGGSGS